MAIAILCGKDKLDHEAHAWLATSLKSELLTLDSNLDIQIWPEITDQNQIECALVWRYRLGELNKFPHLKGIFSLGAGVDYLFTDPQLPKNIPITRIVDPTMARDITQYVVTAILNYICRNDHWRICQQQKKWGKQPPFNFADKTVGIMGLGFLGSRLADALTHLQINTIGWSKTPKQIENVKCYASENEFKTFLNNTDILVCLLPHTQETENIINNELIAELRDQAYIINVARGALLVEEDLIAALNRGKLSGASLDVFRLEPLDTKHIFWSHAKIRVTPHIAAVTNPVTIAHQVLENYRRLLQGKPLLNQVDVQRGY